MRVRLTVPIVLAALALASCGSLTEPAATVDGVEISEDDLRDELALAAEFADSNQAQAGFYLATSEGNFNRAAAREVLRQRIQDVLVVETLDELGGSVTDADVSPIDTTGIIETEWLGTFVGRQERIVALQRVVLEDAGVPSTAQQWFAENGAALGLVCSSHILLETEEDAIAARERVVDSGEDFATVAMELSTGPSGPTGGDLGCGDPSQFVPEFADAVRTATVGEIGPPVETQFGWHVILVTATGADVPFEAAEADATAAFEADTAAVLNTVFIDLLDEADIEVSSRYGTWVDGQIVPDDLIDIG
ncbi:MAG: peptidylprolyl isomerase [Actinomycetota bacterium]